MHWSYSSPVSNLFLTAPSLPAPRDSVTYPWPECDVTQRPECADPAANIEVPSGVNISLVENRAVPQGGAVFFECDDPEEVTSLGKQAAVSKAYKMELGVQLGFLIDQ